MKPTAVMIAGPNGSGKSTLTRALVAAGIDLGLYVNPDDIAARLTGSYDSRVLQAQREADRLRAECIRERMSFSFETVMSHPSKLDVMDRAREAGFRTALYFVATEDPSINVRRVEQRVALGGHPVPEARIVARYFRTLDLLPVAILRVDQASLFDNTDLRRPGEPSAIRLVARFADPDDRRAVRVYPPTPVWTSKVFRSVAGSPC